MRSINDAMLVCRAQIDLIYKKTKLSYKGRGSTTKIEETALFKDKKSFTKWKRQLILIQEKDNE
jgi:hypothetical protein